MFNATFFYCVQKIVNSAIRPNHGFKSRWLACYVTNSFNHIQNVIHGINFGMSVGADGIGTYGYSTNFRNFFSYFSPRQNTALSRFSAWLNLSSNILTCSCAATSRNLSSLRFPYASRTPYLAVPI